MSDQKTWSDKFAIRNIGTEPSVTNWTKTISDFLIRTEVSDTQFQDFQTVPQEHKKNILKLIGKEQIISDARQLIRDQKFQHLGAQRRDKVLTREIEQFKESLELGRHLSKIELETADELVRQERKHRKIRGVTSKTIRQECLVFKKPSIFLHPGSSNICSRVVKHTSPTVLEEMSKKEVEIRNPESSNSQPTQLCFPGDSNGGFQNRNDKKTRPKLPNEHEQNKQTNQKGCKEIAPIIPKFELENMVRRTDPKQVKMYYWSKWKLYTAAKKKEKEEEKIWKEKINTFMQRLNERSEHQRITQEKNNKPILRRQRGKTAPNNPIRTIKDENVDNEDLDQISLDIAKSTAETQFQLRAKSVQSLHPSLQGKAKLIRIITTIASNDESIGEQETIEFPEPEILTNMNQRHEERKQRLAEIQERKRRLEEEKDRIAKEKYEQQLLEAENEKRRKIREFRAKLRRERIEQEQRKQEWMRMKALNERAIRHYNYKLITKFGIHPLLRLVEDRRVKNKEAELQNTRRIKRMVFAAWRNALEIIQHEKMRKAVAFRARHLMKHAITEWRSLCYTRKLQLQVAEDWYDNWLVRTVFEVWIDAIYTEKREREVKWQQAVKYYHIKLATKCLKHWMLLPQVLFLEREKEHRKKEWREKVKQVLPDFRPILQTDY